MNFPNRLLSILLLFTLLAGCDEARIMEENKDLPSIGWDYQNKLPFDVIINDTNKTYNVYVNLRVDNGYPYSNMFLMVNKTSPGKKYTSERHEVTLLDDAGNWLGKGLGDLYDYSFLIYPRMRFTEKGIYHFELEQNMRLDTLRNIKSAGMRVEDYSLSGQ